MIRNLFARASSFASCTGVCSAAQSKLDTQPKGIATSSEGTAFIAEVSKIEAFRSNQKIAELPRAEASVGQVMELIASGSGAEHA